MKLIIFIIIGYILGALPNGVWIGKYFRGIDIREHEAKTQELQMLIEF